MTVAKINQDIVKKLIDLNLTISTCESITGGLVASQFVSIENASRTFLGGLITYSNQSKIALANVSEKTIKQFGAISEQTAIEMAKGVQEKFKSDLAISTTGNASILNPMENKSGISFICIRLLDKNHVFEYETNTTDRNDVRIEVVSQVVNNLWKLIKDMKK